MIPPPDSLTVRFPRRWVSAKNNQQPVKRGRRMGIGPNKRLKADQLYVTEAIKVAAIRHGPWPLWPDCDIKVTLHASPDEKEILVTFSPLRPKPKSPTGRGYDLQNLCDILMDKAQGIVYGNDSQVAEVHFTRTREE